MAAGICIFLSLLREGAAGWIWAHAPHTHNAPERKRLGVADLFYANDAHVLIFTAHSGGRRMEKKQEREKKYIRFNIF